MKQRILEHFEDEERMKVLQQADELLTLLADCEIKIGEDGATAAFAGVIFAHLAMLLELDKPDRVTAFFDDLEYSMGGIGINFKWEADFEAR